MCWAARSWRSGGAFYVTCSGPYLGGMASGDGIRVTAVGPDGGNSGSEQRPRKPEARAAKDDGGDDNPYECSICFDAAKEPIVTPCGHLYCWPCINEWMNKGKLTCPLCNGAIAPDTIIPLYVKGRSAEDPRKKHPPRPQAHRQEAPPQQNGFMPNGFGFTNVFFGLPMFALGLPMVGMQFNLGGRAGGGGHGNQQNDLLAFVLFLLVVFVFLFQ
eukprot:m.231663 g.231663  ORF g.231663 m.231663 type:complete len:215 (+) comp12249_c0_seq1:846-1490(+)